MADRSDDHPDDRPDDHSHVLFDDLDAAVGAALDALAKVRDADWDVPAPGLTWTCWEVVEHVADDLFAYAGQVALRTPETETYVPFGYDTREGGPHLTITAERERGNAGLLQVLEACGTFLSAVGRRAAPGMRGWHPYGVADPGGFAAMGTVEVVVHLHDVADPLGLHWRPDEPVVARALDRLFPDVPRDAAAAWPTLLWATGRGDLPGQRRCDDSWRWDSSVR
ncbi:MAG: maleylpyruvate isomerase N-terminal domain-containing protein [Nocardioidaceae bacterium]